VISMAAAVENPRERVVQETLEAVIWPGESLLGFTQCRFNPGEFLDKTYCVGLTPRRFLLVCKDQPDRVYSIFRSMIERVHYKNGGMLHPSGLELKLGGEAILLETVHPWNQRAIQIARLHKEWELESPYLTSTQFLESITDLTSLGLLRPAQTLLRKHMADDPVVEIEPRSDELDYQITQGRLALWLSLGTLSFALFYSLGRVLCGAAWAGANVLPVILLLLAAVQLVRWQQAWRGISLVFTLLAAILNLAYSGFASFAAGTITSFGAILNSLNASFPNSLMWAAFGAANLVALTGTPRRARSVTAATIFAVGFLAPLMVTGAAAAVPVLFGNPQVLFSDDFSTDQGWISRDNDIVTSRIEAGAYEMHVKEISATFFAFPPVHFSPTWVSVDTQVSDELKNSVGTYGVTCGYSEWDGAYLVEIDPTGNQFAFVRQDGKNFVPLNAGYWQPVIGTQIHQGTTHLEVNCENSEISLKINGLEQEKIQVPGFSWNGKMGIFVRTWPDSGSQGFEVLFDNANFQRK
jgi:hypothetical protein